MSGVFIQFIVNITLLSIQRLDIFDGFVVIIIITTLIQNGFKELIGYKKFVAISV